MDSLLHWCRNISQITIFDLLKSFASNVSLSGREKYLTLVVFLQTTIVLCAVKVHSCLLLDSSQNIYRKQFCGLFLRKVGYETPDFLEFMCSNSFFFGGGVTVFIACFFWMGECIQVLLLLQIIYCNRINVLSVLKAW